MFWHFRKLCKTTSHFYTIYETNSCIGLRHLSQSQITINSPSSKVLVEKDENITLIGINRERARNSLDAVTSEELSQAIKAFEEDTSSPVAVLYGIGGSFSTGYDVVELEISDFQLCQNSYSITRRHTQKPIIGGISGFCVGSGFELALLCDLRVMEDTAIFGFFNRYLGVPMCDGGTVRLAQIVGYSRALDIIATGRRVSAEEAFEIGLINRIVATGTALGQAVNLALSIAKFTQHAIRHDRACIYNNVYESKAFNAAVQEEIMLTSNEVLKEMQIGVRKFRESESKGAKVDSFNIKEKKIPDWEKLEVQREKEYAQKQLLNSRGNKNPT